MKFPSQKTHNNRKGTPANQGPNTQQTPNRKSEAISAEVLDWASSPLMSFFPVAGLWDSLSHCWQFYIMGHRQNFCWKWFTALFRDMMVIISISLAACCFSLCRTRAWKDKGLQGTLDITMPIQGRLHGHAQKIL